MSCDTFEDALVDVARGRDVGAGTIGAVEAHVEHCAACHARFAREVQLSEGLRALAQANESAGASAAVEATLLAAFADHISTTSPRRAANPEPRTATRALWWRTAAAIALLAASSVAWWAMTRSRIEEPRPVVAVAPGPHGPEPAAAAPRETTPSQVVATPPRRSTPSGVRRAASPVIRPEGFVALPSAAGLPAFESGEIVRVEVPVTSLPTYGIDITPDARGPAVEADFLVGQDGQARAIRLVRDTRAAGSAGSSR
jgi:hypothetical protein